MADWVQFAQHLLSKIEAEVENCEKYVAAGGCGTFEDYRYQVGRVNGLRYTQDTVRALLKNTTGEDDD
jgi:hypothetical protein